MSDSFKIKGPAIISFSGGRTSAFMLHKIVAAHGGTLPDDVKVVFANTGKEMPQTLDFVRDCGERWGVEIVWLEFTQHAEAKHRWKIVNYETAARGGEPFSEVLNFRRVLPNPIARICTREMKILPMIYFAKSLGWKNDWTNVLGLRADEQRRVARLGGANNDGSFDRIAPLARAGITKRDVQAFWQRQNFDLRLPNINGTTPAGNCDLCFLKSASTISGLIRDNPGMADWWIEAERRAVEKIGSDGGARFRKDRPGYAEMAKAVREQNAFDFGTADNAMDCLCTDDMA